MKSKIILLIFVSLLFGCDAEKNPYEVNPYILAETYYGRNFNIIEIDSCEYLILGIGQTQTITHKGNCKYCLERNKKNCK